MKMAGLARLAGVSVSTVSKAFSGSKEVSKEQRERIFEIAKKYGCYDKYCKTQYNGTVIAVICREFESRLYSEQLSLFDEKIRERGAIMIASSIGYEEENLEEILEYYTENAKVSGVITMCKCDVKKKFSVPVVSMHKTENFNSFDISEGNAVVDAIKLFKDNGHQKIAAIYEKKTISRVDSYINAMKKNEMEINPDYILVVDERFEEAGYVAMDKLLDLPDPPTAVLAAYDNIAIGAMKSIQDHGLKIPEDISIIGTDNIRETSYLGVPLTSITLYNDDLADVVLDLLFGLIEKKDSTSVKHVKILRELVIRDSVGKAKEKQ